MRQARCYGRNTSFGGDRMLDQEVLELVPDSPFERRGLALGWTRASTWR